MCEVVGIMAAFAVGAFASGSKNRPLGRFSVMFHTLKSF
jgi:hypothetical protein